MASERQSKLSLYFAEEHLYGEDFRNTNQLAIDSFKIVDLVGKGSFGKVITGL